MLAFDPMDNFDRNGRRRQPRAGTLPIVALLAVFATAATAAAPKCCDDPEHFPYETLPATGSVDITIDAASPSFEFQTGVSAFRAYRLPATNHPFVLTVHSFISGGPDPARARVFYPLVAVLNDDFLISRLTDIGQLHFDQPFLEAATAPAYRITLPFGESRERYLVIFTPADLNAADDDAPSNTPDAAAELARRVRLGAAPGGHLRITVEPLDAEPVTQP